MFSTDKNNLLQFLESFRPMMSDNYPRDFDDSFKVLVQADESIIAFENLISELYEFDIAIHQRQSQDLEELIKSLDGNNANKYVEVIRQIKIIPG